MRGWEETRGDEWGPTRLDEQDEPHWCDFAYVHYADHHYPDGVIVSATSAPPRVLRALLRADDLRRLDPSTKCDKCGGMGVFADLIGGPDACRKCHGSGRNLTPDELKRWKEYTK